MFKRCAQYVSFSEMLHKISPSLRLVVHDCIHSDWYKWCHIVIVWPLYMSVCKYLGFHIGLSDEY